MNRIHCACVCVQHGVRVATRRRHARHQFRYGRRNQTKQFQPINQSRREIHPTRPPFTFLSPFFNRRQKNNSSAVCVIE